MRDFLFRRGFILPVVVTAVVPTILLLATGHFSRVELESGVGGGAIGAAGVLLLISTTRLFERHGGALAPWNPPRTMVVTGPYRYLRNPMISGIFLMLLGEAVTFRSPWLGGWLAFFVTAQLTYVAFEEEPKLRQRFGADYEHYCRQVPRWIPRLTPYRSVERPPSSDA